MDNTKLHSTTGAKQQYSQSDASVARAESILVAINTQGTRTVVVWGGGEKRLLYVRDSGSELRLGGREGARRKGEQNKWHGILKKSDRKSKHKKNKWGSGTHTKGH